MGNQPSVSSTSTQKTSKDISNQQVNPPSQDGSNSQHVYTKMSPEEYLEYQAFLKQKQTNSAPPNPPPIVSNVQIPQTTTSSVLDKDILDKLNRKPQASLKKTDIIDPRIYPGDFTRSIYSPKKPAKIQLYGNRYERLIPCLIGK